MAKPHFNDANDALQDRVTFSHAGEPWVLSLGTWYSLGTSLNFSGENQQVRIAVKIKLLG